MFTLAGYIPFNATSQAHAKATQGLCAQKAAYEHIDALPYMCIDLKTFYASVECADRGLNPFTTNLVVADPDRGEGTICLAVTPALKAQGVRNRCRVYEIPKDITYIKVKPRMQHYVDISARIRSIYEQFCAPCDIFPYSIDECFIYIAPYIKRYNMSSQEIAQMLIDAVYEQEHICATAGIGSNMFLAKIAMDIIAKHNNTHMGILTKTLFYRDIWHHRPLTDIWGIGSSTAQKLARYGVFDLHGVCGIPNEIMLREFGIGAHTLIHHAWGLDFCTMTSIKAYKPQHQSMSNGQVLLRDYSEAEAKSICKEMIYDSCLRLIEEKNTCSCITLEVMYTNMPLAQVNSIDSVYLKNHQHTLHCSHTLSYHTASRSILEQILDTLWDTRVDKDRLIRKICITLGNLKPQAQVTPTLFEGDESHTNEYKLAYATLAVKHKYGKNSLLRGTSLLPHATGRQRNQQIGGHHA